MNWVMLQTFVGREMARVFRIWRQTLLPPLLTSFLYFEIFGHVLGRRIGSIEGVDYIAFMLPGLLMMNVVVNAYTNSSFSVFYEKFQQGFVEFLSSPMSDHVILLGFAAGSVMRGLMTAVLIAGMSFAYLSWSMTQHLILWSAIISSAFLFAMLGILNGFWAEQFEDTALVPTFVLTPLTFLGGIFFPVSGLSGFWKTMSAFNPMVSMCDVYRRAFIGQAGTQDVALILVWFVLGCAVWGLCWWLMNRTSMLRQ